MSKTIFFSSLVWAAGAILTQNALGADTVVTRSKAATTRWGHWISIPGFLRKFPRRL
ncbi:MAG TPA: hypothetical protein VGG72_11885 [Bryobacteraceae bacterium]